MGNDSEQFGLGCAKHTDRAIHTVSALFTDVVQCLGTPLLEIKKSLLILNVSNWAVLLTVVR